MTIKNQGPMRTAVHFKRPPVFEVACGVLFSTQNPVLTAHIGAYWQRVRSNFPRVEDAAPLASVVEQQGFGAIPVFEFANVPPLRRAWFFSADGRNLIQLQQDRFLFNWKRASDSDPYPSYPVVIEQFDKYLADFMDFCGEVGIGELSFRQFELAYVNHISAANGLEAEGIDRLLIDHVRSNSNERFLPEPEGVNWASAYPLPDGFGRLHIAAQTAVNLPTQDRVVRLDLTARGISPDTSAEGRKRWFDVAHEWITHGFADATSPTLHSDAYWQRTS
ncbi:TIGR04255 family protein [Burkholderia sp. S171]|uniref:TIGR04255 family protein n=1 Tax=Burkholderia sp. S171 TaxID=1641860 RepID=UPI00131EA192|nr:TIGR04255 family protein [Burkholderia sp. S171]